MGGNWGDHPELVRLRENYLKRKVSAEDVAEVKAELEVEKRVVPVVRVIEDKPFKPAMIIKINRVFVPVLSGKR